MAMKAKDLPVKEAAMQGFGQAVSTGLKYMDHNRIQEWVDEQTNLPTDPTARREAIMTEYPIYKRFRFYGSLVGLLAAGYMTAQGRKGSDLVTAAGINMATDVVDLAADMMLKKEDVYVYPGYGRAAVTYAPRRAQPQRVPGRVIRTPARVAAPVPMRQQNGQSGVRTATPALEKAIIDSNEDVRNKAKDALDREYTSSEEMWLPVAESMSMSESISINEFSPRQGQSGYKYQVALSFAGEDRKYAKGLAGLLENKNISFFYDKYEQADLWGKDLYPHLQSVYRDKAQYCVVFLSQAYAQKPWTRHELESAQARAFREHKEYILPVKIDDTEIHGINETIGYIDLRSTSLEEMANMLEKKLSFQNLED